MFWLTQLLVPLGVCVALPVLVVWIYYRSVTNRDNKNAEIIIKAIECNSTIDADKLVAALGKQEKTPAEVLQVRLLRGCMFTLLGIAAAVIAALVYRAEDFFAFSILTSGFCLAVGLAYLIVYFVTRKSVRNVDSK